MRRLLIASTLFLAGCATRPLQPVTEAPPPTETTSEPRGLIGLDTNELIAQFGRPALQVREGASLKLQFRGRQCVLDAYLYPHGRDYRVTHVDARTPAGTDVDQAACAASLEQPS